MSTATDPWSPLNVLIPIYYGFNTLDVNGPLDVINNFNIRQPDGTGKFNITTTAKEAGPVLAYEGITIQADECFEDSLTKIKEGQYDVMIVPGAGATYASDLVDNKDPILDVIKAFYECDNIASVHKPLYPDLGYEKPKSPMPPPIEARGPKWLISICTGGLPCAGAGVFKGINATTHFGALTYCEQVCKDAGAPAKSITRQRWVDGGAFKTTSQSKVETHILSSGGISCGLDASLYFVSQLFGIEAAYGVAKIMDYNWNVEPVPTGYTTTPPVVMAVKN